MYIMCITVVIYCKLNLLYIHFRFVGQLGETALHGAKPDFMGHVFIPLRVSSVN